MSARGINLLRTGPYIGLVALIELVLFASVISLLGWSVDGTQHVARYTARLSFLLFLLPFLASSLGYWVHNEFTRALRLHRRSLGLGFAFAHFVHLTALISFFVVSGEKVEMATLIGGGLGYVFVALLALTSNDAAVRRLGRGWIWLHRIGVYYIWFIFAFTYFTRLPMPVTPEPRWIYVTLFALAVAALAFRLATGFARYQIRRLKRR